MNIEDEIVPKMITKYLNTLGNETINKMTCSDTKYNFSVRLVNLYKGEERWDFADSWRREYDYILVIDSEIPVPYYVCDKYKKKHFKNEFATQYPLDWAFKPEMEDDLKYMSIDLKSYSFGRVGLHFKNRKQNTY